MTPRTTPEGPSLLPAHALGEGSYKKYKQGCRCDECRAASTRINTAYRIRRRERDRLQLQAALVAEIMERIAAGGDPEEVAISVIRIVARTESEWRRLGGMGVVNARVRLL